MYELCESVEIFKTTAPQTLTSTTNLPSPHKFTLKKKVKKPRCTRIGSAYYSAEIELGFGKVPRLAFAIEACFCSHFPFGRGRVRLHETFGGLHKIFPMADAGGGSGWREASKRILMSNSLFLSGILLF